MDEKEVDLSQKVLSAVRVLELCENKENVVVTSDNHNIATCGNLDNHCGEHCTVSVHICALLRLNYEERKNEI